MMDVSWAFWPPQTSRSWQNKNEYDVEEQERMIVSEDLRRLTRGG